MKKITLILIIVISVISVIFFYLQARIINEAGISQNTYEKENVLSEKSEIPQNTTAIDFEDKNYLISWTKSKELSKLSLIANFSNKLSSEEIKKRNSCKTLVSGGFYDTDNTPIGLFINSRGKLGLQSQNQLFNGFLSINYFETPRITDYLPNDNLRIALQSGPLLVKNSYSQTLKIKNDKSARRIIAAVDGENQLYFLAIYDPQSVFMGPLLEDLPEILEIFEIKSKISIADAINLDGGSASCFMNDTINLSELTFVGSFFCQR